MSDPVAHSRNILAGQNIRLTASISQRAQFTFGAVFRCHTHQNLLLQHPVPRKSSKAPFLNHQVASPRNILAGAKANVTLSQNSRATASISQDQNLTSDKFPVQYTSEVCRIATMDFCVRSLKHCLNSSFPAKGMFNLVSKCTLFIRFAPLI